MKRKTWSYIFSYILLVSCLAGISQSSTLGCSFRADSILFQIFFQLLFFRCFLRMHTKFSFCVFAIVDGKLNKFSVNSCVRVCRGVCECACIVFVTVKLSIALTVIWSWIVLFPCICSGVFQLLHRLWFEHDDFISFAYHHDIIFIYKFSLSLSLSLQVSEN